MAPEEKDARQRSNDDTPRGGENGARCKWDELCVRVAVLEGMFDEVCANWIDVAVPEKAVPLGLGVV